MNSVLSGAEREDSVQLATRSTLANHGEPSTYVRVAEWCAAEMALQLENAPKPLDAARNYVYRRYSHSRATRIPRSSSRHTFRRVSRASRAASQFALDSQYKNETNVQDVKGFALSADGGKVDATRATLAHIPRLWRALERPACFYFCTKNTRRSLIPKCVSYYRSKGSALKD